jgi:hypothetical protein
VVVGVHPPQGVESAPGSRMLSEGFIGVEGEAAKVVVVRRMNAATAIIVFLRSVCTHVVRVKEVLEEFIERALILAVYCGIDLKIWGILGITTNIFLYSYYPCFYVSVLVY